MTISRFLDKCSKVLGVLPAAGIACGISVASAAPLPAPAYDLPMAAGQEQSIVLAGGCFWGIQAVFQHVRGVTSAISGYAGGAAETARYDYVSTGGTGHAEAVKVTYDPALVSPGTLLQVYFAVAHDPTQLNRQGPDHGTQYRSEIFFTTPEQEKLARAYIAQLDEAKAFSRPIVTKVSALDAFYAAEDYHQDYAEKHPSQPYIMLHDLPKVEDLKRLFPALYATR